MIIENEELDENALFDQAVSDEPEITPEPEFQIDQLADAKAEIEAKAEPEQTEAAAEAETEVEKTAAPDNAGRVPAFRLREEAEARRRLENDLAQERADKAALRQRLEALERPAQKAEPEKPARPDPLLDPEGFAAAVREDIRQEMLNDRRETSLATAHKTHGKEFEEAYASAQKNIDPALKARMQQSRDPGETLIAWHREEKAKAEVGTDLNAYKQKLRDEALKDPEFRKAAMEAWRTDAQPQNNGRPRVELPPSLNGASRSNAALRSSQDDLSDAELFEQTTG